MAGVRKQKSAHRPMMESGFPVIAITDAPCRFAAFTDAATTAVVPEKEKATTTSSFVMDAAHSGIAQSGFFLFLYLSQPAIAL